MVVPVEITWTTGQVVTAAQLNANVRDAVNFLLSPPMAVLRQTVAQSLAASTTTAINMDVEDLDRDNGHSTVSNTSRYTAQTPGWYALEGVVAFAVNSSGSRRFTEWFINGAAVNATRAEGPPIGGSVDITAIVAVPRRLFFNTADYAELRGFQDSGIAINSFASGSSASYFGIQWCSN